MSTTTQQTEQHTTTTEHPGHAWTYRSDVSDWYCTTCQTLTDWCSTDDEQRSAWADQDHDQA